MESLPWTLRKRDPGRIRFRVRSSRTGDTSRRLCLQGVPEVTSLSLIHYSKIRLSVSRCSLYFLHFLRRITHTTSFHPPFLITSMPENRTDHQLDGSFQVSEARMPAEFGLAMAIFVVIASMVGVGVLTTSGYTMAMVGSNEYMLALWVVGGVIAACGALTLAELSAALPHTGGDYVYLYHAYGPLAAFLSGWASFLVGFSGPSAASAFASAKYLLAPLGLEGSQAVVIQRVVATTAILIFAVIHVSGRERTAQVQGWITGLKLAVLGLLIVAGLVVGWPHSANLHDPKPVSGSLVVTMMFSLVYIYYAYTGWNGASYRHRPKPPLYRLDTLCGKAPKVRRFCWRKNVGKGESGRWQRFVIPIRKREPVSIVW